MVIRPKTVPVLYAWVTTTCALAACAATSVTKPIGTRPDNSVESRFSGTPVALLKMNNNTAGVVAGQQPPPQVQAKTHVVQKGDTLFSLARRYNTTVDTLRKLNGLKENDPLRLAATLQIGTELVQEVHKSVKEAEVAGSENIVAVSKDYPLRWPVEGPVTSRFGRRDGRAHDGIDIGAPKGTKVLAAADGEVLFSARHGGYGNLVLVRHGRDLVTVYAHHEQNLVRKGQRVRAGQAIAKVGTSGQATGPHLHFEVRRGVNPENPLQFLPP